MTEPEDRPLTQRELWAQFLPLSLSDVTMAAGDPLVTMTLGHLPEARTNLIALGVAKALAVFFESPIIMMLHASNALAASARSRAALWRFMLIAIGGLAAGVGLLTLPPVFAWLGQAVLGIVPAALPASRWALSMFIFWPALIGWRRFHQGLLIHAGQGGAIARAGTARLGILACLLAVGYLLGLPGWLVGAGAMMAGLVVETALATRWAHSSGASAPPSDLARPDLPGDLPGVFQFYRPLATSMVVVWGGRALLLAVIARAGDAGVALAAWPAAWGFVLLIANATRMVQQVVIRNHARLAPRQVATFAMGVGAACAGVLAAIAWGPGNQAILAAFIGSDASLSAAVKPVFQVAWAVPLLVAGQNAAQGLLIARGRTAPINVATWAGTAVLLTVAAGAVAAGLPGAVAAICAMGLSLATELGILLAGLRADTLAATNPLQTGAISPTRP